MQHQDASLPLAVSHNFPILRYLPLHFVADFFIIANSRPKIESLQRDLAARYGDIKSSFGANLNFLRLNFKFIDSTVHVSIPLDGVLNGV